MLYEGAQLLGESGKTYLAVSPLGQANVWAAVDSNDSSNIVVIKEPGEDDTRPGWPNFQNEMVIHELLKDCEGIRKQVDRIAPTRNGDPPMLVLEIFETTLWKARTKRPLSSQELKRVMKDALHGLSDVHAQGQVYADLKMPNIMVDGFNSDKPSDPSNISAKLGDLGIVMAPTTGKVQPVSYRAPEVYFKGAITSKADIWSWGLIYCHLLEAQTRFSKTGLYDDFDTGSGTMREREQAVKNAMSNDYDMQSDAYFRDSPLPPNDVRKNHGDQWQELRNRGLAEGEVDFLRWVMRADPRKRPSAQDILKSGWLDKDDAGVAAGFLPPMDGEGRASMEFDPRRSSAADVEAERRKTKAMLEADLPPNTTIVDAPTAWTGDMKSTTTPAVSLSTIPNETFAGPVSNTVSPSSAAVTTATTNGPIAMGGRTATTVQDAIEHAYPTRDTYKRQLSENSAVVGPPIGKKVYAPPTDMENVIHYNAPGSLGAMNADKAHEFTQGADFTTTEDTQARENVSSITTSLPSTRQERPGISTQNTGTFLSYR